MEHITRSPEATKEAGRVLAQDLRPGDVVLLTGDLGTGKTTFVQGLAEGLGATIPATSPSFVLVNEYPLTKGVLRHLDLYRLADPAVDLDRIGLPELLADPDAITVVEWADRLPPKESSLGTQHVVHVRLHHGPSTTERTLDIKKNW